MSPAWLALMQALSFAREESHARELAAQRPAVAASHLLNACRNAAHGSAAAAALAGRSVALSVANEINQERQRANYKRTALRPAAPVSASFVHAGDYNGPSCESGSPARIE